MSEICGQRMRGAVETGLQQVCDFPEVFMLRTPDPEAPNGYTNCFIVRSRGEHLVIDVGSDSDEGYATFMDAFAQLGVAPADCSFALTHPHVDHAGMVERLVPKASMLYVSEDGLNESIRCHAPEYAAELHAKRRLEGADDEMIQAISYFGPSFFADISTDRAIGMLRDGDVVRCGELVFQVIDTTGHSIGHVAFFEPRFGLLFCGDAVLFSITPMTDIEVPYRDGLARYIRNLERLRELDVRAVFQGHGKLGEGNLRERACWLEAHFQQRICEVESIVRREPGLTGVEVIDRMTWSIKDGSWRNANPALLDCVFETGCVAIDQAVASGLVRRETDASGLARYFSAGPR